MSVGKGDDGSDGAASEDYDEEEDDEEEYSGAGVEAENGGAVATKLCAYSRVCTRMSSPPSRPPDQAGASSEQQQASVVASGSPAPKETGTSMLFVGSLNAGCSSGKDHQARPLRQAGPLVNNYYTTLLTSFPTAAAFNSAPPDIARRQLQSSEQSLREILSDPVSGELMEDATIFPCGHSFGAAGVQKIQETRVCFICQAPTRVDTGSTNFALRVAVQAFKQERGIPRSPKPAAKKRRDQDAGDACDGNRNKGVQFPYVVHDRVLIKGNKRTPERFVGKEAIITTQCLNGWYLVRTIDNGESVRLQYRSLQKIEDQPENWHQEQGAADFASVDLGTRSAQNS